MDVGHGNAEEEEKKIEKKFHFENQATNDVVNFRGRGWVECACIRWERSRNLPSMERGRESFLLL